MKISAHHSIKKGELLFLLILPVVAFWASQLLRSFEISLFPISLFGIFFHLPLLFWLSFKIKNKVVIKDILLFTLVFALWYYLIFAFIFVLNNQWDIHTAFIRPFNVFYIEELFWAFVSVYNVVAFYKYFFRKNDQVPPKESSRFKAFIFYNLIIIFIIYALWLVEPSYLMIRHSYFWVGLLVTMPPIILFLIKYPRFLLSFLLVSLYFIYFDAIFEFTGLYLGVWEYTGDYIVGLIDFKIVKLPLEELLYFIIFGKAFILTVYEFLLMKE